MEAINGWIKAELFTDFHVTGDRDVAAEVDEYIVFFNEQRPAYSLNYLTSLQYRERFAPAMNCRQILSRRKPAATPATQLPMKADRP